MKEKENIGRILSCLHRHGHMYLHREFSPWALGSGSHYFLLILSHHDGLTQAELTEVLHLDKANTTRTIKKLLEDGYVHKQQDPHDHRAVRIYLTDKGRSLVPKIRSILHNWTDILTIGMLPSEKKDSLRLLKKMVDNAVKHVKGNGSKHHKCKKIS